MSKYLLNLDEVDYKDLALVGGKAASLGEMLKADILVPPGFVITTKAYSEGMTKDLTADIYKTFDRLGLKRVAVRSSAVAEDSSDASWAGQLDTALNVTREGLIEAVEYCWKSIQSDRAQNYASYHNVSKNDQAVAVVVQMMVDSDVSGVMFTANPVSNDRNEVMIEAIYGLGELLVQGLATPDNVVVDKTTEIIKSQTLHRQKVKLIYRDLRNKEVKLTPKEVSSHVIAAEQVAKLVHEAKKIENHYGRPQDLEWAFHKDKLYLIQSRPITTLNNVVEQSLINDFRQCLGSDKLMRISGDFMPFQLMIEWWNHDNGHQEWQSINPIVIYFTKDRTNGYISRDKYRGIAIETFTDLMEGRRSLDTIKAGYETSKNTIQTAYDNYFLKLQKPTSQTELMQYFGDLHKEFQVLVALTLFYEQLDEAAVAQVLKGKDYDLTKIWQQVKLPVFPSFDSRKKQIELDVFEGSKPISYIMYALSDYTFLADEASVTKVRDGTSAELLQKEVKRTKLINQKAKQQFEAGLKILTPQEIEIVYILQWIVHNRDDRKFVINQLELLLYHLAQQLFEKWGIDIKYLPLTGISEILQGPKYIKSIANDLPMRSNGFAVLYRPDQTARISYDDLDVQIEQLDQVVVEQMANKNRLLVEGEVGNVGKVTGTVHVIHKRSEFDSFKNGEILVTGMTRPEFVPLMERAVAIVTDEGGITSHAAIIAREMNKPCIIGTRVATQVLKTGDIAEVDANMGIVTILSQEDYYLGEPEDIFYWGPSRAKPIFMSDFMSAVEHFFVQLSKDPIMPTPPETLVLFSDNKMVWLSNSKDFNHFVKSVFRLYEKRNKLDEDLGNWRKSMKGLDLRKSDANELVEAWAYTLFPEFSLYGARDVIAERLQRFDQKTRQIIWGAFTLPEKSSFMTRIDEELYESKDPVKLALKYPWIEDGYSGTSENAEKYFAKRLKLLNENPPETTSTSTDKQKLINEFGLSDKEVSELSLARQLAEMLDERKEWMMRTRRNITEPASKIEFGWLFKEGGTTLINKDDTDKLWDRYINFKTMSSSLEGMVACSGGEHFITGHVTVLNSPTDSVGNDQILVVPSTSPSYVPLMRKAKALITDHGGMMSHAAIVARELNLPCIVATKQATKVLKTGDKIIIDLARGVISK